MGWCLCSDCLVAIPSFQLAPLSPMLPQTLEQDRLAPYRGKSCPLPTSSSSTITETRTEAELRLKSPDFPTDFLSNPFQHYESRTKNWLYCNQVVIQNRQRIIHCLEFYIFNKLFLIYSWLISFFYPIRPPFKLRQNLIMLNG